MLHVQYEAALQRLRLFSLVRRRIRGDLICMYKVLHDLLVFPCDTVFAASTRFGFLGYAFKIRQQRCKTHCNERVFPCWNRLLEEMVNTSSVETFKLRRDTPWQFLFPEAPPPLLVPNAPSELVPPCRIRPLCFFCSYSWSSIVVFPVP